MDSIAIYIYYILYIIIYICISLSIGQLYISTVFWGNNTWVYIGKGTTLHDEKSPARLIKSSQDFFHVMSRASIQPGKKMRETSYQMTTGRSLSVVLGESSQYSCPSLYPLPAISSWHIPNSQHDDHSLPMTCPSQLIKSPSWLFLSNYR